MAPDDNSGGRPAGPVVLRIKLRYDDLAAMVQRFAPNVGKSGMFLPTRSIQPVGTEVKFELRLANNTPVLVGVGRVKHVRAPDPANPRAAFGMAIELMRVSREGRDVIIRMIERRRAMGLPDVAIPLPEDAEAARRSEVETQPRGETSGVVRDAMAQLASAGPGDPLLAAKPASGPVGIAKTTTAKPVNDAAVTAEANEPAVTAAANDAANEPAVPASANEPASRSSSLMTAPRAGSGPMALARDQASGRVAVPALAPEKARPRRPRVEELIDRAAELSARIAVVPASELDMQVDVESVLTRARALAGGDLDVELATLREAAAAPIEITVEAASAELARQLGGKPISKRERSARWETPPPVELRHPLPEPGEPVVVPRADAAAVSEAAAPEARESSDAASDGAIGGSTDGFSTKTRAETEADAAATIAAVVSAAVQAQAAPVAELVDARGIAEAPAVAADAASVAEEVAPVLAEETPVAAEEELVAAEAPITEPLARIDDDADADDGTSEFERDDRTELATSDSFAAAFSSSSTAPDEIDHDTQRPSRQLFGPGDEVITEPASDSGLMIDDNADVSALQRALDGASASLEDESDMLASGEYQLADDAPGDSTQIGGPSAGPYPEIPAQLAAQLDQQLAEVEAEAEREYPHRAYAQPDEQDISDLDEQEVSELDVIAEADEADEDLLAAQEAYAQNTAYAAGQGYGAEAAYAPPQPYAPAPEIGTDDFASRLDLGEEDDAPPGDEFDHEAAREFDREAAQDFDRDAAREFDDDVAREFDHEAARTLYREPERERSRRPSSEPSGSYTFAEDFPNAALHPHGGVPDGEGEEFDEPHSYAPAPPHSTDPHGAASASASAPGPDPRLLRHGHATTEDLEDALAALDVDLDDIAGIGHRRSRRAAPSGPRPLPGLPLERPAVKPAPSRVASPTGPQPAASRSPHPTGAQPVASRSPHPTGPQPAGSRSPRPTASHAKPPPIPAAARRPPTQQVPITQPPTPQAPAGHTPGKRASTEDGILIDFDDDE